MAAGTRAASNRVQNVIDAGVRAAEEVGVPQQGVGQQIQVGEKPQAAQGGEYAQEQVPTEAYEAYESPAQPVAQESGYGQQAQQTAMPTMAQAEASTARQPADQPRTPPTQGRGDLTNARQGVLAELGLLAGSVPQMRDRPADVPTADGDMRPPLASEIADAERLASNDLALPNESTRTDIYPKQEIEDLRRDNLLLGQDEQRVERAKKNQENAMRKAQSMRSTMQRNSAESAGRTKASIFDRLAGTQQRRKAQLSTDNAPTHRPTNVVRAVKNRIADSFGMYGTGARIYGKIIPLPTLGLREVGVGMQELQAVIDQDPSTLDELIKSSIPADRLGSFTTTRNMLVGEVADLINDNEVDVFTAKPPNNRGQDVQRRKLHVLETEQRGIYLHPTMAAMYTADFDGDDMQVSLDPTLANKAKDPMAHMVGIDGANSLDMNLLPVSRIVDDYEDGKTARDFVVEEMLANWSSRKMSDEARLLFNDLVDSVLALSDTTLSGEDAQAVAYGDVFRAARYLADAITGSPRASDRMMSRLVEAVYESMRNLRVNDALMTMGEVVPRDTLPPASTASDDAMYRVIDGMVMGAVPNNFQELKVMMNGFLGNVQGKSAPFRFTADVGKMMKLDTRFLVGGEYVIDQTDDTAMTDLLQKTVKFAFSKRMAVDVKVAGKSYYFTEVLRNKVIKEVGFYDSLDRNGNRRYGSYTEFLQAFARSYNHNAAMINEANLVWLSNMAISRKSNRKTVMPIRNVRNMTYKDLASPFVEVYGTVGFDRMFGSVIEYKEVDPYGPNGEMRGRNKTENDWRRPSGYKRWVKARYASMSLRAFSVDNEIRLGSERSLLDEHVVQEGGVSDQDAVDGMIAAIADKRTSTASKFNVDITGKYTSKDGRRSHVDTRTSGGRKTLVGMMVDPLVDIRNADLEGTLMQSKYYAGIGTRNLKDKPEVAAAMTDLAKRLDALGCVLRSGHASGSDLAFEAGANGHANLYMPYKGFNRDVKPNGFVMNPDSDFITEDDTASAEASVLRYHPTGQKLREDWELGSSMEPANREEFKEKGKLTFGYEAMHRNYYQVMGSYGQPESAFVACYDDHGGGTQQAIRIARDRGIPVFNAAEYDDLEQWKNDVIEAAQKAMAGQLERQTTRDQMIHVDDAVMMLNATNYEMFRDLYMDSTAGFLSSEYGRKMVQYADNPDVLASIREAMVFKWQTNKVTRIADQLRELDMDDTASVARYEDLRNQAAFAMDELSDKSNVWRALIKEMRRPEAFKALQTQQGRNNLNWNAMDFWARPEMAEVRGRYSSIRDVIEDLDMPWPLKCDIIADVVRYQNQDYSFEGYEVAYQLEVGGDARYSITNGASGAVMQSYSDTESASHRYANRSLRNVREEVSKAALTYRNSPGALTNTIHALATQPWNLVSIDDGMYADALLAVRDKQYAQTEKAKKHPWTNAIYSAISYQRNGGFFNDVYRYDDRLLGLQHISQVSPADLVKIFDDPNYMVTVYDDYGSVGFVDQQTLLEIDHPASEQEIWDWLVENPRLACTLRAGAACVQADTSGKGYVGSRLSLVETISNYKDPSNDVMGHVKYLMRDHPVYAGLISMLNPAHGTSVRNERNRVPQVEEMVCIEIYNAAREGRVDGATRVLSNLGITRQKLQDLLISDFDKYMNEMGFKWDVDTIMESTEEAMDIYDTIERHVASYIDEVRREVPLGEEMDKVDPPSKMGMDIESVASFWDTVQELSGAKVGVSTGIEGAETYQLSYWVSHMRAKDHYADLEAIENLIVKSESPTDFDGMWTSKGTLQVSVDESGRVTTNIAQLRSMKANDSEEIVTQVPEGFDVPDRSTDSYGNPVPSLYASMVSKRSNGAEKFNLKAMKAGLDGTDSVTKMSGGKYLQYEYGDGTSDPILFFQVAQELSDIASEQGIDAARMELANRIMQQDMQMGYKDMSLANYMCLAENMLVEGEDGGVILRSLEQLVAGIKGRIGASVDDMSDKQVFDKIAEIVNDTSEQGIGRSQVWAASEVMSMLAPKSSAGDAVSGIKTSSSVFIRNYDLLEQIRKNTDIEPMDAESRREAHDSIIGKGVEGVADVFNRSKLVREYQVIGYAAASDGSSMLTNRNIGPSTAIVIGSGRTTSQQVGAICADAYENGTTVIVAAENLNMVPDFCAADMIPISDQGDMLIPMFDMRLNGSESRPFEPRFAIFQAPFERYIISAEDPFNVFELGDAQYKFTRNLVSRIKARDGNSIKKTAVSLFPNVFANQAYKNATFSVSMASPEVIRSFICNPETPQCTIDYGIVEGANGWDQRVHDVNKAIRDYKQVFDLADDDGVLRGIDNIQPGDIIGWADLTISRDGMEDHHVLAPLIPFELHEGKKVPENFKVNDVGPINNDGSQFGIDWSLEKDIDGFIKYFDSSGGANKGMINLTDVIEDVMRLKNGMDMDAYCASFSTDSRKIGTDRRIKTMISLMAMARMEGYNFARTDGAFPNDPELRERLSRERVPMDVWKPYFDGSSDLRMVFTNDRKLDAFLNYECKKIYDNGGNPSDYLANIFQANMADEGAGDVNSHVMWEFECMFDNGLNYEDSLLKFLHTVNPQLCPSGIDDDTQDTYFRLYRDGDDLGTGFDRGMLQMQVPYPTSDGKISYVWSNVFVGMSFFGEEWAGNTRPNVSGASDMLDAENTESYYGMSLSGVKSALRAAWATADLARLSRDAGALGT